MRSNEKRTRRKEKKEREREAYDTQEGCMAPFRWEGRDRWARRCRSHCGHAYLAKGVRWREKGEKEEEGEDDGEEVKNGTMEERENVRKEAREEEEEKKREGTLSTLNAARTPGIPTD